MAPDFRRVFTFRTQNQEVDYRTSKVSIPDTTVQSSTIFMTNFRLWQTMKTQTMIIRTVPTTRSLFCLLLRLLSLLDLVLWMEWVNKTPLFSMFCLECSIVTQSALVTWWWCRWRSWDRRDTPEAPGAVTSGSRLWWSDSENVIMSRPWCCHLAVSRVKPEARGKGREHSHVTLLSLQNDRNSLVLEETDPKMSFVFHVDLMWQLLPRNVDYNCEQNHSNHQKTVIPGRGLWRENMNESCHKD